MRPDPTENLTKPIRKRKLGIESNNYDYPGNKTFQPRPDLQSVPPYRKTFLGTVVDEGSVCAVFGAPRDRLSADRKLLGFAFSLTEYGIERGRADDSVQLEAQEYEMALKAIAKNNWKL